MSPRQYVFGVCLFLLGATSAQAGYIVTVGNVSISAGSTGYVPVYIKSDVGQSLASTNFEFRITTGGPTRLDFSDSPSPASDPTFSDAGYVFFGNSLDEAFDLPLGTASLSVVPNDSFIGGDATADFSDVTVSTSDLLLAELPITALTAVPPVAGDTFTISLVPVSGSDFSGNTGFADSGGQYSAFTSTAGTVTIVPEPSSWLLAVLATASLVCYWASSGYRTTSLRSWSQ